MRAATRYLYYRGMTPRMLADPEAVMRRAERLEQAIARDQQTLRYLLARWVELQGRRA